MVGWDGPGMARNGIVYGHIDGRMFMANSFGGGGRTHFMIIAFCVTSDIRISDLVEQIARNIMNYHGSECF